MTTQPQNAINVQQSLRDLSLSQLAEYQKLWTDLHVYFTRPKQSNCILLCFSGENLLKVEHYDFARKILYNPTIEDMAARDWHIVLIVPANNEVRP